MLRMDLPVVLAKGLPDTVGWRLPCSSSARVARLPSINIVGAGSRSPRSGWSRVICGSLRLTTEGWPSRWRVPSHVAKSLQVRLWPHSWLGRPFVCQSWFRLPRCTLRAQGLRISLPCLDGGWFGVVGFPPPAARSRVLIYKLDCCVSGSRGARSDVFDDYDVPR